MLQIKISITEEEHTLLQERANENLNSVSREARLILRHVLYNEIPTPASVDPITKQREIAGLEFPAFPDYKITSTVTSQQPTPTTPQHTYTPDPDAGSVDVPYIDPATIKDYRKPQDTSSNPSTTEQPKRVIGGPDDMPTPKAAPKNRAYKNNTLAVPTDLEVEQVDNEWDAECNQYSTEEFLVDLRNLENKLRDGLPPQMDPTKDQDYVTLKNYFIKHDLRERFRSLLSDPSRFYPEEGVYEQPQIKYAQAAFKKEKIDYDYIVALLSGTGADYRTTHNTPLYIDEQ